jgi:hypothetical protein
MLCPDRLLREDGADFERLVHQALNCTEIRQALRRTRGVVNAEQLRTLAMRASAEIAASATVEYAAYRRRRMAAAAAQPWPSGSAPAGRGRTQLAAILAALVPPLAAVAAAVFLLLGYGLELTAEQPELARSLVVAGWTSALVSAVVALAGAIALVTAAARTPSGPGAPPLADPAVAHARAVWQATVWERGLLPFLRRQLATPCGPAPVPVRPARLVVADSSAHPRRGGD